MKRRLFNPWRRPDHIVIYEDRAGEFRWRRVARNGRIVADSSEGYSRKFDARRAALSRFPTLRVEYA